MTEEEQLYLVADVVRSICREFKKETCAFYLDTTMPATIIHASMEIAAGADSRPELEESLGLSENPIHRALWVLLGKDTNRHRVHLRPLIQRRKHPHLSGGAFQYHPTERLLALIARALKRSELGRVLGELP